MRKGESGIETALGLIFLAIIAYIVILAVGG